MEQLLEHLPYGLTINGMASILQEQLIIKQPNIIIYAVNDLYIYSANNLESLKDMFIYENLEIITTAGNLWVLTSKPRDNSYINIYTDVNRTVQPKVYTFFRLDAVNTVLRT